MPITDYLEDEQGNASTARLSFWVTLICALVLIVLDSTVAFVEIPAPAYVLLGTVFTLCGVWAAGPRMAQYLAPQIGAMVSGIASAVRGYGTSTTHFDDGK